MLRELRLVPLALTLILVLLWLLPAAAGFPDTEYSVTLLDRNGVLLGAIVSADEQWRFEPSGDPLPERYVAALIAFEDERFWQHPGVDPIAIARAIRDNARAGRIVSGGSTITMQLARLVRGGRERTLTQKVIEAAVAVRLELVYSKHTILQEFVARAPFGGNVVGIDAASWRIFGRPLKDVTWAEASLLAVLPNSPSLIHISQRRSELVAKRDRLLDTLLDHGAIDGAQWSLSRSEPIPAEPRSIPQLAPHLLQTLASVHDRSRFETTIDAYLQQRAKELLVQFGRSGRRAGAEHAAALIVEIETGAVEAYVGNLPPRSPAGFGDFVDIVQARRSTGSLLKPFLFAAMVDAGEVLPDQIVPDIPVRIGGYVPQNPDRRFSGAVRADEALARSLNVPAATMLRDYGVSRFTGMLGDFGFTTFDRSADEYGVPLILGGAESTLWELTGAYASLGRSVQMRGDTARPYFMPHVVQTDVSDQNGRAAPVSSASAFLTLQALEEVERPGELLGWQNFAGRDGISWKTGTSYGLRDAWAIGVGETHAVGVWVGNASGAGAPGLRGTAVAGPIMFSLFELLPRSGVRPRPGGLQTLRVCADSGHVAGPQCRATTLVLAPGSAFGHEVCPYCRVIHLDETGSRQVTSDVYPVADMLREQRFVLPPAMAYYYERTAVGYESPPPFDERLIATISPISVEFPLSGARVYVPLEMSGERGSFVARAHHQLEGTRIHWHLDGTYLGSTVDEHQMEMSPAAGEHLLSVVDAAGNSRDVAFTVLGGE